MTKKKLFKIALVPGDGIGPEVIDVALALMDQAGIHDPELKLEFTHLGCGAGQYQRMGQDITETDWATIRALDAVLLGATGLPDVRYANGTEVDTPITLREKLELTASIRPAKSYAGVPPVLAGANGSHIDFIVVRETTEGLFAGRNEGEGDGETYASNRMTITRAGCDRLFDLTFALARERKAAGYKGKVTLVDKANVVSCLAFLRKKFYEHAARYPDIEANHLHVDAASLLMIRDPHQFDVVVTENQYGDILSEVGAAVVGGLGLAPSADIGGRYAVFQPSHGSAPDITGKGIANPMACVLSAAMMLGWLGKTHDNAACRRAAALMEKTVERALSEGALTRDLGGELTTRQARDRLLQTMKSLA